MSGKLFHKIIDFLPQSREDFLKDLALYMLKVDLTDDIYLI